MYYIEKDDQLGKAALFYFPRVLTNAILYIPAKLVEICTIFFRFACS